MAAKWTHVVKISTNLSNYGLLRPLYSSFIGQRHVLRVFCSESNNQDDKNKPKLNLAKPKDRWKEKQERKEEAEKAQEIGLDSDLIKAAESVAESLGGDVHQTHSDLLQQLKAHAVKADAPVPEPVTPAKTMGMGDLLSSMKFERPTQRRRGVKARSQQSASFPDDDDDVQPRRQQDPERSERQRAIHQQREEKVRTMDDILRGVRLNIFNVDGDAIGQSKAVAETPSNPLFDEVDAAELIQQSAVPPDNAFEEMIQWTKEGKLWKFPIDNEQGWETEKNVGFHEHVFLDHLLVDFPQTPAIQHFMELVTTGLSMNPYLTVEMKKEHISWFKEYITSKTHLIEEDTEKTAEQSQS